MLEEQASKEQGQINEAVSASKDSAYGLFDRHHDYSSLQQDFDEVAVPDASEHFDETIETVKAKGPGDKGGLVGSSIGTETKSDIAKVVEPEEEEPNRAEGIVLDQYRLHKKFRDAEKVAVEKDLEAMREETTRTVGYGPYQQGDAPIEASCGDLTEGECHTLNLGDQHFSLAQRGHEDSFVGLDIGAYDAMNVDQLYVSLKSTLNSALKSEQKGDADAAVAKTAAIKNIQKALTARILKRLDDGQPLVEVARKMKAIEGMQPQINDMERRLGIMQSVEPVLENAIKTLQKVVDVRGMGKK